MHGGNLSCFFRIVENCYRGTGELSHTHAYNIYRYSADRKKIIIILKKVAKKFGGLKNMLYLCSRK